MFQFPGFALTDKVSDAVTRDGLPHSEICGSKDICSYPQLIAAYHVLRRLREPRHPSCALVSFLFDLRVTWCSIGCVTYHLLFRARETNFLFVIVVLLVFDSLQHTFLIYVFASSMSMSSLNSGGE